LPVIGLWPTRLADTMDAHLAAGPDRSIRGWARAVGAVPVQLAAAIPNVNRPSDLNRLR
jgi:molybdenum cofactor guanylyltransferase